MVAQKDHSHTTITLDKMYDITSTQQRESSNIQLVSIMDNEDIENEENDIVMFQ
jgi:hypothetical protein